MAENLPLPYGNLIFPNTQNQTASLESTIFNNKTIINGLTFPLNDGTDGQVIATDGNGNLSFKTSAGGVSNVISVNGKTGVVDLDKTNIGLSNVDNQSVQSILSNSELTENTSIENLIQGVKEYTGPGPHNLSNGGKINNIIIHDDTSYVILPLDPTNGFITRVINYGTGNVIINKQSPNIFEPNIETIELNNNLDKSTFLFYDNIWNLI